MTNQDGSMLKNRRKTLTSSPGDNNKNDEETGGMPTAASAGNPSKQVSFKLKDDDLSPRASTIGRRNNNRNNKNRESIINEAIMEEALQEGLGRSRRGTRRESMLMNLLADNYVRQNNALDLASDNDVVQMSDSTENDPGKREKKAESAVFETLFDEQRSDNEDIIKDNNQDNDQNEEDELALSEDIYSLMYIAPIASHAFVFSIFVWVAQSLLLWLILFDLIDFNSPTTAINLPPGVSITVTVAQALGVVIIVFFVAANGDMTNGLSRLVDGYDRSVLEKHPGALRIKWFFSGLVQVIEGMVMIVVLFILMMQSTDVIGMCLNFAALHFVQDIDDVAFYVGSKGFISRSLQFDCLLVSTLKVPKGPRIQVRRLTRQIKIAVLLIGLYVPYGILVHRQLTGQFVCRTIFVQFGDAYLPELAYFSGRFRIAGRDHTAWDWTATNETTAFAKVNFRPVYFEKRRTIKLAYCSRDRVWGFSFFNHSSCQYFVRSPTTTTFSVVDLQSETWLTVNLDTRHGVNMDWLVLSCDDCGRDPSICPSDIGTCTNNACECHKGRMGVQCQFAEPTCDALDIDERTAPFPPEDGVIFPGSYRLYRYPANINSNSNNNVTNAWNDTDIILDDDDDNDTENDEDTEPGPVVQVKQRPVYVTEILPVPQNYVDYMFFTGRRWVIYAQKNLGNPSQSDWEDTAQGLSEKQQAFLESLFGPIPLSEQALGTLNELNYRLMIASDLIYNYRPYFFSEPVDFGTPSDVLEPTGLGWFRARRTASGAGEGWEADEQQPVQSQFLCSVCHPTRTPCMNGGTCDRITRRCVCDRFFTGSRCELPIPCDGIGCLNNGTCVPRTGFCDCVAPFFGNLCQFSAQTQTLPS